MFLHKVYNGGRVRLSRFTKSTDLTRRIGNTTLLWSRLNEQLVVLAAVFRILAEENAKDRVIAKNVRVVKSVPRDSNRRSRGRLLELHATELDDILVLRQFEQHGAHGVVALDDVRQTVEAGVVQYVADHVRMDDAAEGVVHERTGVYRDEGLGRRADVVRRQVGAVRQLDVHQRVHCDSRVSGELDKGVQGERQAIVQFVREVLEQAWVVDSRVEREIGRVDEVSVLLRCLGCQNLFWIALVIAHEFGLCLQTKTADKVEEVFSLLSLRYEVGQSRQQKSFLVLSVCYDPPMSWCPFGVCLLVCNESAKLCLQSVEGWLVDVDEFDSRP